MKLKEFFTEKSLGAAGLGMSRFRLSSDKEKVMTPHTVMQSVYDMLDRRPSMRSGLSDIVRFILADVSVSSEDDKSVEFMQEWMKQRKNFDEQLFLFVYSLVGVGTGYMQPFFTQRTNGSKLLNDVKAVPDSSIIYKNIGCSDDADDYWLMQVPFEVQEFDGQKPEYRPVWYIKGSRFNYQYIWCIGYTKNAYDHATFGHSRSLPWYGHGLLSTAVDNNDIQEEIMKNWALQAKYRALGKKIIGFYNSSDEPVSLQELEDLKNEFSNLEEEDSILVNKRFDQVDLSFTGQDSTMDQQIDFIRRDNGSSLTPNFMTAFSQDSSMATASEAKIPFGLKLKSIQPRIVDFLNTTIIDRLREVYPFLAEDLSFDLGMPELYSREEVFNMLMQLYNIRACTFNEIRDAAGLPTVEGGDVWGAEPPLDNTRTTIDKDKSELQEKRLQEKMKMALKESAYQPVLKPSINVKMPKQINNENKTEGMKTATKKLLGK